VSARRALTGLAALLGGLAAFAGSPYRGGDRASALELAAWIKDRKPGLLVIDLRPAEEFDAYHVPGARNVPMGTLAGTTFQAAGTLVLYAGDGATASRACTSLRAAGYREVYFLGSGLSGWLSQVMSPTLAPDASAEETAAFQRVAALSRYFGGVPRIGDAKAAPVVPARSGDPSATAREVARIRRRGC